MTYYSTDLDKDHVLQNFETTVNPMATVVNSPRHPLEERLRAVRDRMRCPACNLLPFEALSKDETPAPTTVRLEDLDLDALKKHPNCGFCLMLLDLRQHWLSEERGLAMKYDGVTYRDMCGMSDWRMRYTDHTYLGLFVDFGM